MGVDLESIMSKPVRALSGCFQLPRPSVCISSMLKGKPGPCFLPQSLSLYFIFTFTELKVKGVVCLFIYLFIYLFCESKVGKKFRFIKVVHAEDTTLRLKTDHIESHFQFIIIFFK